MLVAPSRGAQVMVADGMGDWLLDLGPELDEEGWEYAADFASFSSDLPPFLAGSGAAAGAGASRIGASAALLSASSAHLAGPMRVSRVAMAASVMPVRLRAAATTSAMKGAACDATARAASHAR